MEVEIWGLLFSKKLFWYVISYITSRLQYDYKLSD